MIENEWKMDGRRGGDYSTLFPSQCIHRLFEERVEKIPTGVAISDGDRRLTYEELNRRSNQLARYLRRKGIDEGSLLGVCMDQSPEMVVSFLAILKAGCAYVPLDPSYPDERLHWMAEDTRIPLLLTQSKHLSRLSGMAITLVCPDLEDHLINQEKDDNLSIETDFNSLAYVIYTSGSTGKPKGVMVPQKAVNRLVLNTNYIQIKQEHKVGQASNCSFDAATFEIWGALLNGAELVILSKDMLLSSWRFAEALREKQVDILFLTTALFNQLARDTPKVFQSLEYLLFGGEAVDCRWVRSVLQQGAPRFLLHVYGPTENTTFSTWYRVDEVAEEAETIPIGRPISHTWCAVLDESLQPVPVGEPGELFLGGEGLAQGYLHQSELTQERFVSIKGEILYRTGDRVRQDKDRNIEFLGRVDDQVKIRGFRIEPGEIAAVLNRHPDVLESVVISQGEEKNEKRLVAYLLAHSERQPSIHEIRLFLEDYLPDYMVPSFYVFMDKFPITPNGKLDKKALPKPGDEHRGLGSAIKKAEGPVEEELAKIWSELLGLSPISVDWNFLKIGGHSLLATQVLNRIRERFGIAIPLSLFFEHPTVSQLARIIEKNILEEIEGMSEEQAEKMIKNIAES